MASQQKHIQQIQKMAAMLPACAGLALVLGQRQDPSPLCLLVSAVANRAFGLLPSVMPTAWQAVSTFGLTPHWFPFCPLDLLIAAWRLVELLAVPA